MLVLDRAVADVRAPDGRMEVMSEWERKEEKKVMSVGANVGVNIKLGGGCAH